MLQSHGRGNKATIDVASVDNSAKATADNGPGAADDLASKWYVLGFGQYSTTKAGDPDTWAEAVVHPGGAKFKSRITKRSKTGYADLHMYVPTSATFANVYIRRTVSPWWLRLFGHTQEELVAESKVDLSGSKLSSWCSQASAASFNCSFNVEDVETHVTWVKRCGGGWWSWACWYEPKDESKVVGNVKGYLAKGTYLQSQVDDLHMRGVAVKYDDYEAVKYRYAQRRISADSIAQEMSYAKTGSVFPKSLHGVWWMDQRGRNTPIPGYPNYTQKCATAVDEILMSFGMADWDEESQCALGVTLKTSSPFKGQWALIDTTGTGSSDYEGFKTTTPTLDFCFKSTQPVEEIEISIRASINSFLDGAVPAGTRCPKASA